MTEQSQEKQTSPARQCCFAMLIAFAVIMAVIIPIHLRIRSTTAQATCLSTLKSLNLAMMQYAQDYNDHFPPAHLWNEKLLKTYYGRRQFEDCPSARTPGVPDYAMNAALSSYRQKKVRKQEQTVLVYESVPGINRAGGPELLPKPGRHMRGNNISFVDGHAKYVKDRDLGSLLWKP